MSRLGRSQPFRSTIIGRLIASLLSLTTGTVAGSSTVTGVGFSTAETTATGAGSSTVTGVGQASSLGAGTAAGVATVTGVGSAVGLGVGSAAGTATATAVGSSVALSVGTTAGTATPTAVGSSVALSTATAVATSTADAVGSTVGSIGVVTGTSTVSGVGQSIALSVGTASATSTASASGLGGAIADSTGNKPPMPNFNFHVNPLYAETLTVSNSVKQLTASVFDGVTSNNQEWSQKGIKRRKARVAKIYVDTANSIRWTKDGTAPVAATTGALGRQFDVIYLESYAEITHFKAIRDGGTDSSIQVEYYG